MKQKFNARQWLLIGLLLRLSVMPFTKHADMLYAYKIPHLLSHGNWDAYGIAARDFGQDYFPPLALIFFAVIQLFFCYLVPPFEGFAHSLLDEASGPLLASNNLFLSLFIMKLPYLVIEGLLIRICWDMLSDENGKKFFSVFWAVNPLVIYGIYMMGQIDLIPTFLVILGCAFIQKKGKEHYACLALSAGCLFKVFPIVFLPMVFCLAWRRGKSIVRLFLYGVIPIIIFYGIFYLISGSSVFKLFSVMAYTTRVSFDPNLLALRFFQMMAYGVVCFHILFFHKGETSPQLLVRYFVIVYLAVYWGVVLPQTHYFIWFTPFLILLLQQRPEWRKPFYFLLCMVLLSGFRARTGAFGIFSPLNPEFFTSLPSLKDVTGYFFNQRSYDFTLKLLFNGTSAVIVFGLFRSLYRSSERGLP